MLDATDRRSARCSDRPSAIPSNLAPTAGIDAELLAAAALLSAAVVIGAVTISDYGITVDEFNANDYGLKALAWFGSGFRDRSMFDSVEDTLWYYGPWFHIIIAFVQSHVPSNPWTIRHAMTFAVGILGIAAVLPMGRLACGRWAGLVALILCLGTGYLYGSLFFTPIDVPFLAAMTWTTLAVMVMAQDAVPTWSATLAAGALTGLTIATRSSGVITQVYLVGAMVLCGLDAFGTSTNLRPKALQRIAWRTICALIVGWVVAIAMWPWLQIGNPVDQFRAAFLYFANHPNSFEMLLWGRMVVSDDLPWFYIPGQLAARLPEGFLLLLTAGVLFTLIDCSGLVDAFRGGGSGGAASRVENAARVLARTRARLVLWAALLLPVSFIIVAHSTLYDGIRHVLFLIPLLAVVGGYGFVRLMPVLCRFRVSAFVMGGAYAGLTIWNLAVLHPLEYVAMNSLAGGVGGAYARFGLDYWSAAATVGLRRLERRLDYASPETLAKHPSMTICMGYRQALVSPMFERPWLLEVDPAKADYIVATESWPCAESLTDVMLIDEVKRFGRTFAWIYERRIPEQSNAQSTAAGE